MDNLVLIFSLALVLVTPLCLNPANEGPSIAEQRFLDTVKENNQTKEDLKAAIDSEDYTKILQAISKYNYSIQKLSAGISDLCADKEMSEKYSETCSQTELLKRCNTGDVEGTVLIMRLIHDPQMTKEDCNKLLSLIDEQEECRTLAQTYVPTRQDKAAVEKYCEEL
jgi:uncharacterized secreted protein with C-terminal beta-propeller domain